MRSRLPWLIYLNLLVNTMAWQMGNLFLPLLAKSYAISELGIGILSTTQNLALILMLLPAGILADSVKRKNLLLVLATLVEATVQLLYPLATVYPMFLLIGVVHGLTQAIYTPTVLAISTQQATLKTSGRIAGVYTAVLTAGMTLGSYTGGVIAEICSISAAYTIFGVLTLLVVVPVLIINVSPLSIPKTPPKGGGITRQWRDLLGGATDSLRPLYIAILLRATGFFSFYLYFPLYVASLGLPPLIVGAADALNTASSFASVLVIGYITDRFSPRGLILVGFYGHVVLTVLFAMIVTVEHLFLTMIFAGIIWAAMKIGTLTIITRWAPPSERGRQNSLEGSAYNAGRIIGSPINGYLIEIGAGFQYAYWFTGILCLVGSLFLHTRLPKELLDPAGTTCRPTPEDQAEQETPGN